MEVDIPYSRLKRNQDLPFRLTRNIVGALSGSMLLGGTTVSLGVSIDSFLGSSDVVESCVSMLLYEDVRARQSQTETESHGDGQRTHPPVGAAMIKVTFFSFYVYI